MSAPALFRVKSISFGYRVVLGLTLTALFCASYVSVWNIPLVDTLDRLAYDARVQRQNAAPSNEVVIVDIDERALAEVGRWPWSRATMADMTTALSQQGRARTIGFDVLFAETQDEAGRDQALVQALKQSPAVLGYYLTNDRGARTSGQLPAATFSARAVGAQQVPIHTWSGYGANLAIFQEQAKGAGFFSPILDADGIIRRVPLIGKFNDEYYESFPVAVLRHYLGQASAGLNPDTLDLVGREGRLRIPISTGSSVLVPFAGGTMGAPDLPFSGRFPVISAADVVRGTLDWSQFRDRIVLIGTSAPGLSDLRATPISRTTAGVEIHATVIAGALAALNGASSQLKQAPHEAQWVSLIVTGIIGCVLSVLMPISGAVGVLVFGAIAVSSMIAWNAAAFTNFGWLLPGSAGLLLVLVLSAVNLGLGYFIEGRARQAVSNLFGEYVSPAVVAQMTRDPLRFGTMVSENRELTILFADIRGFTRISETMEPAQLREFINEFLTAMTDCVYRYDGTVDKYIGDAVMAFWGAPLPDERHADHAVSAALAMQAEVQRLNALGKRKGWPHLAIGVGVNTGIARVGDMGSKLRRAYTVLGDSVNLASRLEALTKQFNTPIIVGEATAQRAQGHQFVELAQVTVAGRTESTRIFVPTVYENRSMQAASAMAPTQSQSVPDTAAEAA